MPSTDKIVLLHLNFESMSKPFCFKIFHFVQMHIPNTILYSYCCIIPSIVQFFCRTWTVTWCLRPLPLASQKSLTKICSKEYNFSPEQHLHARRNWALAHLIKSWPFIFFLNENKRSWSSFRSWWATYAHVGDAQGRKTALKY